MSVECRQDGAQGTGGRVAAGGALFSVAVALTALNLRPAVTSVGPLLDETRASLGASETWAGLLTTVPVLCFAVAGLIAPLLARRAGVGAAVSIALALLAGGLVIRVLDGSLLMIGGRWSPPPASPSRAC
ncbi:hypothetical protein [Nonomuraea dietziae]|uniref:hypothetical protein n=1 Tax=Nonomuraea dietziae TaxID=65515 RepID=UPI0031D43041